MKKLFSRLFIISLSTVALSGCDLFSIAEEELEADGLELKNYKTAVIRNTEYEFTGSAYLKYTDDTGKISLEKDVTEKCTFPTLDTSGDVDSSVEYKVSYESTKFIYSKTVYIKIVDKIKLESIEVSDFSTEVLATDNYTFDGKVIAKYTDNTEKDVTDKVVVTLDAKQSSEKAKELVVSYTEDGVTKSQTKQVKVYAELASLSISGYSPSFEVKSGAEYSFDGQIKAKYSDNSTKTIPLNDPNLETDFSNVDLSKLGTYTITASYTERNIKVDASAVITVTAVIPKLQKIVATDYTATIEKGNTYTFDGVVTATFDDGTTADVTSACTYSSISTTSAGSKNLTITYNDKNSSTSKYTTIIIEVISKVSSISAPTTINLGIGKTTTISVTFNPSDATNKNLTFTSADSTIASVDEFGVVTGKKAGTTTISIVSNENSSATATTTINVSEVVADAWTILLYMCGADLESQNGLATSDLNEIKSVSGQDDEVNFVIQTGGASSWQTSGISASYNQRFHVENKKLVSDNSKVYSSYKSMGLSSTLQDFIEWGINTYPAEKVGLIFWNHGGAMRGVCYDEKKSDDCLLTNEVTTAVSGALSKLGMTGEKLEFVGYDACLMQVQDIASVNSDYFNYMIASEESEAGEGWDYDTWVDDLFAKKSTETILKAIVDGFIADNGGVSSTRNDQTLSYLDLSKMPAYITAWNNMAKQLANKITSSNKSSFNTLVKKAKYYADSDYTYYGIFDAKDFVNKLSSNSTFNPGSDYTNAVLTAFSDLVAYSSCGKGAGNSYGLCLFWAVSSNCAKGTYYTANMTKLTDWRTLVTTYGY